MMNFNYPFTVVVWMFIIVKLNVLLVVSKLIPLKNGDAIDWREYGENANLAKFNNLYAITIDEENLREDKYCSGNCNSIDDYGRTSAANFTYPNQCTGVLKYCWLYEVSEKRKQAEAGYESVKLDDKLRAAYHNPFSNSPSATKEVEYRLNHTGNICTCLCERLYDPNPINERGNLLNSMCLDPVSVDERHVATGVRFKRYDDAIHLELQQAKLINGRIVSKPTWKISHHCQNKRSVARDYFWPESGQFSILAEDLVLSEDAVVTGVTFGESLRGRYINRDGNFDSRRSEFTKSTQCIDECAGSWKFLCVNLGIQYFHDYNPRDDNPKISTGTGNNYERSVSCKSRIFFRETSFSHDGMQHVVPYVDLQEVVTDPPEAIHGIGWYLRGFPGYGGFLALKIFIKE